MSRVFTSVEDYRRAAKRRLPRFAFDFVDGGADSEHTVRSNRSAFESVAFRPQQALGSSLPDLKTSVLGQEIAMPVLLAPCGLVRVINPAGDLAGARAAGKAGTGFVLSTMSNHPMEQVAEASSGPIWYQVYQVSGRDRVEVALDRAAKAGYSALVVTIDTQVNSIREKDHHNRLSDIVSGQPRRVIPHMGQALARPSWLVGRLRDGLFPRLENVIGEDGAQQIRGKSPSPVSLTWQDLSWVREQWGGEILVKGVLSGDDARRAVDSGVGGVIVSNHGGRQLDYAEPTIRVLPEVVAAVGDRCDVLLDSGVRRGTDVMKALCLGAKAVLVGRAWVYALGAAGQSGVEHMLTLLRADMIRNMTLLGCKSVHDLGPEFVRVPRDWSD